MGYTHYWRRPLAITPGALCAIALDFQNTIPALEQAGVKLAGGLGEGEPEFNEGGIFFNGPGDLSHETLCFPGVLALEEWEKPDKQNRYFQFCKTARKPYDLAVAVFLIIAKHHLGRDIKVSSDGGPTEWRDAKLLSQTELGYGGSFRLDRH